MTPERIAELKGLCAKATLGPWKKHQYVPHAEIQGPHNSWFSDIVEEGFDGEFTRAIAQCLDWRQNRLSNDPGESPNADFIAAARTALPELLAALEALYNQQMDKTRLGAEKCAKLEAELTAAREQLAALERAGQELHRLLVLVYSRGIGGSERQMAALETMETEVISASKNWADLQSSSPEAGGGGR